MVREPNIARQSRCDESLARDVQVQWGSGVREPATGLSACEHRTVAKDGRIVCARIVDGDDEVSPNVCRACPFKAVNCAHLRFSLSHSRSAPLIVRCNGRTEIWDDGPAQLRFERAACTVRVTPIVEPRSCAGCALRQALQPSGERPVRRRATAGMGKVVPFRSREALAPTG